MAQTRKPLVSTDLANDVRFIREAVVKAGFRQIACIPLLSGENLMGVLSIASLGTDPIDDRNVDMMAAVGNWAGLAIENARLHSNARRLAVLEERERIGMDLHDGIIQSIYGVGLSLENAFHSIQDAPFTLEEMDPAGLLPERPYTRDELRTYLVHGRKKCQVTIESLTDEKARQRCGFDWLDVSFAELLLFNMRHVQHHAAQLNLILRQTTDSAPRWVRKTKSKQNVE